MGPPFGRGGRLGGPVLSGGRGRKRRGDVRAALLLLIAEEPRNGYQLMQITEERSGGRWRPSPGSVYPALSQLEDEGLIRAVDQDGARAFELTSAGREHLDRHDDGHVPWEAECEPGDEFAEALHSLVGQLHLAAMEVARAGDARQLKRASQLIAQTKRELYRILAEDPGD
jgi:DNA-binding PadR family transcriptional regulator